MARYSAPTPRRVKGARLQGTGAPSWTPQAVIRRWPAPNGFAGSPVLRYPCGMSTHRRCRSPSCLCLFAASPRAAEKAAAPVVYVSAEESGEIMVVDVDKGEVSARIPVGKRPRGIKLSRDGKLLYVALSGSPRGGPGVDESKLPPGDRTADGVGVVDLASHKLLRTLASGQDPESFDLSRDGKTLYVSNEETAEMSVIDLRLRKGDPQGRRRPRARRGTLRPDGKVVYVTSETDNWIFAVDTRKLEVVGADPHRPAPARRWSSRPTARRRSSAARTARGDRHRRRQERRHRPHQDRASGQDRPRPAAHGPGAVARRQDAVRDDRARRGGGRHRRRHPQGHPPHRRRRRPPLGHRASAPTARSSSRPTAPRTTSPSSTRRRAPSKSESRSAGSPGGWSWPPPQR